MRELICRDSGKLEEEKDKKMGQAPLLPVCNYFERCSYRNEEEILSTILALKDVLNITNPMVARFNQQEFSAVAINSISSRERCNGCQKMLQATLQYLFMRILALFVFLQCLCFCVDLS